MDFHMKDFLNPVSYGDLNSRQKENFNFQEVSALLAQFGFMTIRLSSDWESADFIAQHMDGITFLKVQLKGSFAINKKFKGKDLYICFPDCPFPNRKTWYLCPHDELVLEAERVTNIANTDSWLVDGLYRAAKPPVPLQPFLEVFALRKVEPASPAA